MRRSKPGTVIAVNESDEAEATGHTLDCSEVIRLNFRQIYPKLWLY